MYFANDRAKFNRDAIYWVMEELLAEVTDVGEEHITEDSSLARDLDLGSMDHLDVICRMEERFGIKISRGDDIFPITPFDNSDFYVDGNYGRFDEKGVAELRRVAPYMPLDGLEERPIVSDVVDRFNVKYLANYVQARLEKEERFIDE